MNIRKNISQIWSFEKLIVLSFILIAIVAILIDSQSLAAETNLSNTYLAPFQNPNYILGTDGLGRSVAYGLMNGIKLSLSIAAITALISLILALFFSYLSGYLGNDKLRISIPSMIVLALVSLLFVFYFWHSPSIILVIICLLISYLIFYLDEKVLTQNKKYALPLDSIIMKFVELQKSLPGLFLVLFIFALTDERSLINIVVLITIVRIPSMVRLSRSEVLKIKNQEFITAIESMGLNSISIFIKHIVPNILTPLKTYLVYTIVSTILIESTLSFLGLGFSVEIVTLGSMLSSSREFFSAWWLAIFPGIALFLLIYSLRKIVNNKSLSEDFAYL